MNSQILFYSGKAENLFEILIMSANDRRFGEFLKCFEIIFETSIDDIMEDYNSILTMVNVTRETFNGRTDFGNEYNYERINITDRFRITNCNYLI